MRTRSPTQLVLGLVALAAVVVVGALLYGGVFGTSPASDGRPSPSPVEEREGLVLRPDEVALEPSPTSVSRQDVPPALSKLLGPVYELRGPQDRILADVFVALCKRGEVLLSGRTDESGEFAHDHAEEGMGRLLVLVPGWVPQICEVPLEGGRHMVVLERGSVVSGRVLVSGEEPGERIPISLFSFREPLRLEEVLGLGWARLDLPANSGRWAVASADEHGLFRFQGLSAEWRGELRLPVEYRLEEQSLAAGSHALNALVLDAPAEELLLRVARRTTLVGRVVDLPKRRPTPVSGAIVLPDLKFPPAYQRAYLGELVTDEEGRFTCPLPGPSILGGKIRIGSPGREFFREIEVEPVEVEGELDLGDLALGDPRGTQTISLRIVDKALQPIQGAVAAIDSSSSASDPTDEAGRTTLGYVFPGVTVFAAYALGYEATDVAVPAEVPEELEVVLQKGTLLDLRFSQPDGEIAQGITARLSASEHPFRNEAPPRSYAGYTQTGCGFYKAFFPRDGGVVVRAHALGEGRVVLNDIKPGLLLQLRVEGRFTGVIQEEAIVPLHPGEHRVHEVVLVRSPSRLYGRVVDEAGAPLPQAMVSIVSVFPDAPVSSAGTLGKGVDEDGRFEFKAIYSPTVWFSTQAEGYTRFMDEELEIPEEGAFLEVRLSPENIVTVTIENESGKRLPAESVHAELPGGAMVALGRRVEGEEGVYLMRGLPDEELTITAYVHRVPYTSSHDPNNPELLFTVPVLGDVQATVHLFDESQVDDTWLLCLVPTSGSGLVIRYAYVHDPIIPGVLPGSYNVVIRRFPSGFEHKEDFVETSLRVPIDVSAGSRTDVEVWQQL